jgi:hypothetical protein
MSKEIEVTQFLLPDGKQRLIYTEVEQDEYDKYIMIRLLGGRLTAEILQNGAISQCIEVPELDDYDMVVSANGPDVVSDRRKMLLRFDPLDFAQWKIDQLKDTESE